MAYRSVFIGRIHIAYWTSLITTTDMRLLYQEIREASQSVNGQYIFSVGIAPAHIAQLPSKAVRDYIIRTTKLILPICWGIYNVIEADEPLYTAMVSGFRVMALAGGLSDKMYHERSLEKVLMRIRRMHSFSTSYVLEEVDKLRTTKE